MAADASNTTDGEQTEFMGRMTQAGLTSLHVRRVNKSPDLAIAMVKALKARLTIIARVHGVSPDERKAMLDRWKQDGSFGYEPDNAVGGSCPAR